MPASVETAWVRIYRGFYRISASQGVLDPGSCSYIVYTWAVERHSFAVITAVCTVQVLGPCWKRLQDVRFFDGFLFQFLVSTREFKFFKPRRAQKELLKNSGALQGDTRWRRQAARPRSG